MGYPEGTLPAQITFPVDLKTDFNLLPPSTFISTPRCATGRISKATREQLKIATYQMYQTYSNFAPTVNAYASSGYGTGLNRNYYHGDDTSRTYSENPSFAYGLTADWTIFNGLIRYNQMREYQANVAIADFNVAAQWITVVSEVRAAYANYVKSVKQTRIFKKIRDLSAQQRDLVDEGYKAGNTEITRLNEAQRDLVEAETNLASSYIQHSECKGAARRRGFSQQRGILSPSRNDRPGETGGDPGAGTCRGREGSRG